MLSREAIIRMEGMLVTSQLPRATEDHDTFTVLLLPGAVRSPVEQPRSEPAGGAGVHEQVTVQLPPAPGRGIAPHAGAAGLHGCAKRGVNHVGHGCLSVPERRARPVQDLLLDPIGLRVEVECEVVTEPVRNQPQDQFLDEDIPERCRTAPGGGLPVPGTEDGGRFLRGCRHQGQGKDLRQQPVRLDHVHVGLQPAEIRDRSGFHVGHA